MGWERNKGASRWWRNGREAKQCVLYEVRWNWKHKGGCCSCSLENGKLHCPSIEPVMLASTTGPTPSSFEKTGHCVSCCDSQSCTPSQEEEQGGEPQLTYMSRCVSFSSLAYLLISLVSCGGDSPMRLDNSRLNYSVIVLCLTLARDLFHKNLNISRGRPAAMPQGKGKKTPRLCPEFEPLRCVSAGWRDGERKGG